MLAISVHGQSTSYPGREGAISASVPGNLSRLQPLRTPPSASATVINSMPQTEALRTTSLLLFTRAELDGHYIYRAVRTDVSVGPGDGRLWIDVGRRNCADVPWQRQLQHMSALGRSSYDLPWDSTDIRVSCRPRGALLSGASASLPLFVAWRARRRRAALPVPFFATGVEIDASAALAPAPRVHLQGKLEAADALARQAGRSPSRHPMWVPSGSDYDPMRLSAIFVCETPSLLDAVGRILGEGAPASPARPRAVEMRT
jgi:hypothetical protein